MKRIQSIIYLVFILGSMALLVFAASSYENPFSFEHPLVPILMVLIALVIAIKEYVSFTSQKVVKKLQGVEEDEWGWAKGIIKVFTKSKSIEEQDEIILDHNYDGIQELDNVLPPWWVGLFYATIIFAVVYLVRYEIMGAPDQAQEFNNEMAVAKKELEAYKKANPNAFDLEKAKFLSDADALERGKAIFKLNCASCHQPDGGGNIGPNLTDKYWINGGGFKNVIKVVYNGGREGKGMIAWKATLKPEDIQKVASYVWSLQGTKPAKPKAPQGDLWKE